MSAPTLMASRKGGSMLTSTYSRAFIASLLTESIDEKSAVKLLGSGLQHHELKDALSDAMIHHNMAPYHLEEVFQSLVQCGVSYVTHLAVVLRVAMCDCVDTEVNNGWRFEYGT